MRHEEIHIINKLYGDFARSTDVARELRKSILLPCLEKNRTVEFNFDKVSVATQGFIHVLIAEALHKHGEKALDYIVFKNCNETVKGMIETVVEYVLDTSDGETPDYEASSPHIST